MTFFYRAVAVYSPEDGKPQLILRPEIPVKLVGTHHEEIHLGLLDTGADNTIIPAQLARDLGLPLRPSRGPQAVTFGGHRLDVMLADATFALSEGTESVTWRCTVLAHESEDGEEEVLILGHQGFLDYFTATFDGELGKVELAPNSLLPRAHD